jgi:hypothetical protein
MRGEGYQLNLFETGDVRANKSNSMRAYPEDPKVTNKISSCDNRLDAWFINIPSPTDSARYQDANDWANAQALEC